NATEAAGVEQKFWLHRVHRALGIAIVDTRALAADIDGGDLMAEAHIGTEARGFVGENLVEFGALHLKGGAPAGRALLAKIEGGVLVATQKGGAVLELEITLLYRFEHAGLFDERSEERRVGKECRRPGTALQVDKTNQQHACATKV